jgi:hypothetical protein
LFYKTKVNNYFKTLFKGEEKFGRFLFLKDVKGVPGLVSLHFVRLVNKVSESEFRYIGFSVISSKKEIFRIMM